MNVSTEQAWQELSQRLRRFFRRRVANEHVAEDLLQETFLRIHDRLDSLTHEEPLVRWVFRIAEHILIDHYRKRARSETLVEEVSLPQDEPDMNYNEEVAGWLRQMVQSLPQRYRAAVELAELEGLKQREVSARLGLSLSGAKSRVQRGREKLKDMVLQCCRLELDRRGNVVGYEVRARAEACCDRRTSDTSC